MLITESEIRKRSKAKKKEFYQYWLALQKNDYAKSFTVFENERVFHVSEANGIRKFFPKIPNYVKPGEDNTIARICTSNRILDAFVGMVDTSHLDRITADGGYKELTIYSFEPALSIRPSKKALPNNSNLNERWIVGYDPTHTDYESKVSGKLIVTNVQSLHGEVRIEGYLSVNDYSYVTGDVLLPPSEAMRFNMELAWEEDGVTGKKVETTLVSIGDFLSIKNQVN